MSIELIIILVVSAAGVLGFLGALLLLWKADIVKKIAHYFLSFAVGAMLGAVFFDLLPESFELHDAHKASLLILLGIIISFVVEKILVIQHCHKHGIDRKGGVCNTSRLHASASLVIVGDFIHNFLDGVLVASAFFVSIPLGISAAIAEIAHEIPQEIGDFSVMIASGMKKARVLFWSIVSELGSVLGAVLVIVFHGRIDGLAELLLPVAAGGLLYIALSDLVPELHHENRINHSVAHFVLIVLGVVLLFFVGNLLGGHTH